MPAFVLLDLAASFTQYWHTTTRLELAAVVTGFACVWLAARESIWNFPIAIVSCLFYGVVFFTTRLYSDFGLQGVFIVLSVYGWYEWLYGRRGDVPISVTHALGREWLAGGIFALVFTAGFGYYLGRYTDAALPYVDSFTTAGSLVAQFMLNRKRLENWLLWLLVDIIYVPMYWSKGLYISSLLYALYLGLAAYGYWQWRRDMRTQPTPVPAA